MYLGNKGTFEYHNDRHWNEWEPGTPHGLQCIAKPYRIETALYPAWFSNFLPIIHVDKKMHIIK